MERSLERPMERFVHAGNARLAPQWINESSEAGFFEGVVIVVTRVVLG